MQDFKIYLEVNANKGRHEKIVLYNGRIAKGLLNHQPKHSKPGNPAYTTTLSTTLVLFWANQVRAIINPKSTRMKRGR